MIDYDIRQRQRLIYDKLRAIGRQIPLMCDSWFERGDFSHQQWDDLHIFRVDQIELQNRRVTERSRCGGSARNGRGFRMGNIGIERAQGSRRLMTPACYDVALVLVGMAEGQVERAEGLNAAWEIGQIYRGNAGRERWRDWGAV